VKFHHPKLDRIVLCVIVPVVAAAALLYALFAPSVFQLDENYYLTSTGVRVTGGNPVVDGENVRLWGKYPWVYGESDGGFFLIDLSEAKVEHFTAEEVKDPGCRYHTVLRTKSLDPAACRTWKELYTAPGGRDLRLRLKEALLRRK